MTCLQPALETATAIAAAAGHHRPQSCLLSKWSTLSIPKWNKHQPGLVTRAIKNDAKQAKTTKQILALATTSWLTCFLRPTVALAAAGAKPFSLDSVTIVTEMPGLGTVQMPGMRGISPSQMGGLPNVPAMLFALALFLTTAIILNARDGYLYLMHQRWRNLDKINEKDNKIESELELGLARQVDWGTYSHLVLDPLSPQKKNKTARSRGGGGKGWFQRMQHGTKGENEE